MLLILPGLVFDNAETRRGLHQQQGGDRVAVPERFHNCRQSDSHSVRRCVAIQVPDSLSALRPYEVVGDGFVVVYEVAYEVVFYVAALLPEAEDKVPVPELLVAFYANARERSAVPMGTTGLGIQVLYRPDPQTSRSPSSTIAASSLRRCVRFSNSGMGAIPAVSRIVSHLYTQS